MSSRRKANPTRFSESELGDIVQKPSTSVQNLSEMIEHIVDHTKTHHIMMTDEKIMRIFNDVTFAAVNKAEHPVSFIELHAVAVYFIVWHSFGYQLQS
ncbi:hypothetical protein RB195_025788 [Necator americanus]|uniref:Uncharacterized protein n=1 Tax=Necator americanus TaxID=51031 RepID=A0ABR1EU15_NECAM